MGHRRDKLHQDLARLVGQRIRRARLAKGITQRGMEPLGWNQGLLSSWENGHKLPELPSLYLLASTLGVDPWELLPGLYELGN